MAPVEVTNRVPPLPPSNAVRGNVHVVVVLVAVVVVVVVPVVVVTVVLGSSVRVRVSHRG